MKFLEYFKLNLNLNFINKIARVSNHFKIFCHCNDKTQSSCKNSYVWSLFLILICH